MQKYQQWQKHQNWREGGGSPFKIFNFVCEEEAKKLRKNGEFR